MPLHRDIHWIGRQWAVTGHGMQLIDQKLQGFFDVEVAKLWDDAFIDSIHAKEWLNVADFDRGLSIARARYPQDGAQPAPIAASPDIDASPSLPPRVTSQPPAPKPEPRPRVEPPRPIPVSAAAPAPAPVEVKSSPVTLFQMRYAANAKFVHPWRVVSRKT